MEGKGSLTTCSSDRIATLLILVLHPSTLHQGVSDLCVPSISPFNLSCCLFTDCPKKVSDFQNKIREINLNPIHKPEECEFQAKVVLSLVNMHKEVGVEFSKRLQNKLLNTRFNNIRAFP